MKQTEMASLGGKARAKKYTKKQLSEMGKKGGRPSSRPSLNKKPTKNILEDISMEDAIKLKEQYGDAITFIP